MWIRMEPLAHKILERSLAGFQPDWEIVTYYICYHKDIVIYKLSRKLSFLKQRSMPVWSQAIEGTLDVCLFGLSLSRSSCGGAMLWERLLKVIVVIKKYIVQFIGDIPTFLSVRWERWNFQGCKHLENTCWLYSNFRTSSQYRKSSFQ